MYCGKAARVAVVLDFVLGPAEMAAAVLQCPGDSNGVGRSRTPLIGVRACTLEGPGARGSPGLHKGEVWGLARAC